jgi:hypothetical protein
VSDGLILAACTPAYFPTAMGAKFWALIPKHMHIDNNQQSIRIRFRTHKVTPMLPRLLQIIDYIVGNKLSLF